MEIKIDPVEVAKLDAGIKDIVLFLQHNGVETFESCEGGIGHCFPEPTVRFWGDRVEGIRVAHLCLQNDLPISEVRRSFSIINQEPQTPFWEVTFKSASAGKIRLNPETGAFVD